MHQFISDVNHNGFRYVIQLQISVDRPTLLEIIKREQAAEFDAFVKSHYKASFMQGSPWAGVKKNLQSPLQIPSRQEQVNVLFCREMYPAP